MRFISTKAHAVNDYIFGVMLILVPLIYGEVGGVAMWLPVIFGGLILLQALITDYEFSAIPLLPMKAHLVTDAVVGVLLAVSPWMLGFAHLVWMPHLIVGIIAILLALTTQTRRTEPSRYVNPPNTAAST
jgi:hypothetical protein